jgi:hypothetical protein
MIETLTGASLVPPKLNRDGALTVCSLTTWWRVLADQAERRLERGGAPAESRATVEATLDAAGRGVEEYQTSLAAVSLVESVKAGLDRIREELCGDDRNAAESLAIDVILTAWLDF